MNATNVTPIAIYPAFFPFADYSD